jgi:DNA-binding beta-propeller fold protein YncE
MIKKGRGFFMYKKNSLLLVCIVLFQACGAYDPNTIIATITDPNGPTAITIAPNGLYACICDGGTNIVSILDIDPSSPHYNTITATITGFSNPANTAITPDSLRAYVCNANSGNISLIDMNPSSGTYQTIIDQISILFSSPSAIVITPDGSRAYVADSSDSFNVYLIDTNPSSGTYNQAFLPSGLEGILYAPFGIVISPDGNYVYVSNLNGPVTVIDSDPSSGTYNTQVSAPSLSSVNTQPEGLAITSNGDYIYVTDGAGSDVSVIDSNPLSPTVNTVLSTPNLASAFNYPNGVVSTSDGKYAYVTNYIGATSTNSSISLIDTNPLSPTFNSTLVTPGLTVVNPPAGFTRFYALAITPNDTYVYAIDGANNVLDVIYTGLPPIATNTPVNFSGCMVKNVFLMQTDYINRLTWSAPTTGNKPAAYKIYRDAGLTQLITKIPADGVLQYEDHNRNPNVEYSYYIITIDDAGGRSSAAKTTVTQSCA